MRIAGIDQGTTSTRSIVINAAGGIEVVHSIAHKQHYPQEGWVEHDAEEILRNIITCANAAGRLDAIGLGNQGETCLAWDAQTKEPLTPMIVWQDKRTAAEIENLRKQGCDVQTLARAGLPLDTYFSASKLGWIIKNIPAARDALKQGRLRLGTSDAFFFDRLTGHFVTDVTTASRTSLMNLKTSCWDETLCDMFGVPPESLPEILPTTGEFGIMDTDCGRVPITAGVVDQQAALYGFGCRKAGEAKITFGTGAFALMVTGGEIIKKPECGLLPTVAWQLGGTAPVYALDGGVFTASAAINWAKLLGLFADTSEIDSFPPPAAVESGLVFVPALTGLACPHWQPEARGAWLGMGLGHTRLHLMQAVLEGIAFRAAEVISAMDQCIPLRGAIHIDGGMSRNPYFVQFLADVLGREIRPAMMPELTGLGVLLLAHQGMGQKAEVDLRFGTFTPQTDRSKHGRVFDAAVAIARSWN